MRRWLLGLVFLFIAALVGAGLWFQAGLGPLDPANQSKVLVTVPSGASTAQVADRLRTAGVIKNPLIFRLWVRKEGKDAQIKSGEYELNPSLGVEQIVTRLVKGEVVVRRVVLPEGLTVVQIADRVAASGATTKEAFLKAVRQPGAARYLPPGAAVKEPLEGYLFPAAYDWETGTTADSLVKRMTAQFDTLWTPEWMAKAEALHLSIHQVTTLASIVEAEAVVPAEMPRIAGVYLNRLKDGMLLQADPTVYYAVEKPKSEPLLYKDLESGSPYNTYKVAGLPPGPIGAPGKASLSAVINPEQHRYFYFVAKADGSGEHFFAETLEEHNRNVAQAEANAKKQP
jgi:UPF0755 protein